MYTYSEALELAVISARNARSASTKQVAQELWKMAQYQAEAAKLAGYQRPASGLRRLGSFAATTLPGLILGPGLWGAHSLITILDQSLSFTHVAKHRECPRKPFLIN